MKKIKLLLTPLFMLMGLQAKTEVQNIDVVERVRTGTTLGHYQKPGAPIDMSYKTAIVNANEIADVNITLMTKVESGAMKVSISLDDELKEEGKSFSDELEFELSSKTDSYPIDLQVSSTKEGLYYIRLITKIDKSKSSQLRAFAIPVQIGTKILKSKPQNIMKAKSGESLSVLKADESIETIE